MRLPRARALLVLVALLPLVGCAAPWRDNFDRTRQLRGLELTERDAARIIEVEWERLADWEDGARERAIARDERPDQLPRAVALGEFEAFLDAARVDVPPENIAVVGSSRFISTGLLDLYSDAVRTLTAEQGGDIAVVSIVPLGLRPTVEYATRTEFFYRDIYDKTGERRPQRVESRFEERVPVVVPRDTWAYTLIVLREDEPARIDALTGGRPWLP
jgi:hypothetical protein